MFPVYVNTAGLDPRGKFFIYANVNIAEKTINKCFIFH